MVRGEIEMMLEDMVLNPYTPTKVVLREMAREHTKGHGPTLCNCFGAVFDSFLIGSSEELAMNGTSGLLEIRSSPSQSPTHQLLREHPHKFGIDSWHLLRAHDPIAHPKDLSKRKERLQSVLKGSAIDAHGMQGRK